jgi:hypothetical protein
MVDAIIAATERANALPIPVFHHGRIHEIGVWQGGEWVGSVFHWHRGKGLGAWSSVGNVQLPAASHETAVQIALWGTENRGSQRRKATLEAAEALAGG